MIRTDRPWIYRRAMKRSNAVRVRNFVRSLMTPVKRTQQDWQRLAVELAKT
jgi:hypothetical protein